MRLTEVLVCISIFVLSVVTILSTLTNINQKTVNITLFETKVNVVMNTDLRLRNEITSIETCYWKNFRNEVKDKILYLKSLQIEDVKIISVEEVEDKKKRLQGIEITWEYKNKQYKTTEFIKVKVINEDK